MNDQFAASEAAVHQLAGAQSYSQQDEANRLLGPTQLGRVEAKLESGNRDRPDVTEAMILAAVHLLADTYDLMSREEARRIASDIYLVMAEHASL